MAKRTAWEVKETKDRGGGATAHHSSQGTKTREKKGKESKGTSVQKGGFLGAFIVLSVVKKKLCCVTLTEHGVHLSRVCLLHSDIGYMYFM